MHKIRYVNATRVTLTSIAAIILFPSLAAYLSLNGLVEKNSLILFFLFFLGFIGSFLYLLLWNDGLRSYSLNYKGIQVEDMLIPWEAIKSYIIKDDSAEFKTLQLKTHTGKTIRITHRKKYQSKDGFESLLKEFEKLVNQLKLKGTHLIEKEPLMWDTKWGKLYGYFLIGAVGLFFIVILNKPLKISSISNFLMLLSFSIPLLMRIFKNNRVIG